ncbi:3-carboxy-cis,cis-muconate cycloisomerase [Cryobacterium frigoriphilum]|uniref:3-carboxy-cis,cis-muconate cycloisomerase n=1 Tax=Cryobacterium frigoriphilum TaxID=1259150 RepID=A0A4R9A902_9MICO|nr:lyase family protein [Cryobacterium frigoriphilum]TFD54460.1 3-carboxy-cis,cis-muconate cycloisomerase [Cryobacterium frigoriphilum]
MPEALGTDFGLLSPLDAGTRAAALTGDRAWLQALVDTELALTRSLVAAGLAPDWMFPVCDALTDAATLDLAAIAAAGRGGGNPVIPLVKHLAAAAERQYPGASDHIHVGATSQDILDTAAMLVGSRVAAEVHAQLAGFAGALAGLARDHRDTVMAGRTLGQQASPTSFGFVAAGWLDAVLAASARLESVTVGLPVQFGGAVGNLSVLTEIARTRRASDRAHADRAHTDNIVHDVLRDFAGRLGLAVPSLAWHTNRLPVTDLGSALAAAIGVVGSFALDVSVLSRTEIAELSERLGAGEGGSSAMPHKRNPVTAVLVVAAARQAPGLLATLYGSLLTEDQRPSGAWHAEWPPLRELERLAVAAATGAASLADRLDVDAERMRGNLDLTDGLIFSERVTTVLAEALGKTTAFGLVQRASEEAFLTHRPLQIVLSGMLSAEGADESLRARAWAAFDYAGDLGQSGAGIDRVLARHGAGTLLTTVDTARISRP